MQYVLLFALAVTMTTSFYRPYTFHASSYRSTKNTKTMMKFRDEPKDPPPPQTQGMRQRAFQHQQSFSLLSTATTPLSTSRSSPGVSSASYSSTGTTTLGKPRVGLLLLNLGGPASTSDVPGFLYNLFADPDIIRLPSFLQFFQKPLAWFIAARRSPKSQEAYNKIGGGSPIVHYTEKQGQMIKEKVKQKYNLDISTYIGMRYWYPFTHQALDEIKESSLDALVVLPLYPQFSISTSGSSLRLLQEEFAKDPATLGKIRHTVVSSWYERPGYIDTIRRLIMKEADEFGNSIGDIHVLFSAHGVPQSYIDDGDPYQKQIEDCVRRISGTLPSEFTIHLSYQSRVGPIEWLRPYTDDKLVELGKGGVKNLVVVPISFVSEHIETLEEIDMEYKEVAIENGITNWRRCPALNTEETFIDDMADLVVEALYDPAMTLTESCIANNCDVEVEEDERRIKEEIGKMIDTPGAEAEDTVGNILKMFGL